MWAVWFILGYLIGYVCVVLGSNDCSGDCKQGREKCNCKL